MAFREVCGWELKAGNKLLSQLRVVAAGEWGCGAHRGQDISPGVKMATFQPQKPEETEWTVGTGWRRKAKLSMGLCPLRRSRKLCLSYHAHT